MSKQICAAILGLAILFSVSTSASAQSFRGRLSNGEKAAAIGGGAAAGAVLGGLLGGKKGAIIGGLIGAAGGTGYVYYKGRDDDRYRRYYRGRDFRDNRYYGDNRGYYRYNRFDNNWRSDRRFQEWNHSRNRFIR